MPLQVFNLACALNAHHRFSPLHYALFSARTRCLFLLIAIQSKRLRHMKAKRTQGNYTRNLTPILRSGYPPCAAVSLVVLSPTREGRVCDIQLVIIAMVLSTTPIFSKGTVIFALCSGLLTQAFFILQTPVRNKGDGSCCPQRLGVSPGTPARMRVFWTFSAEAVAANESNALEVDVTGGPGRR